MRRTFILINLLLMCMYTYAQQIDKKLLYGRWEIYSFYAKTSIMCRDSLAQFIEAVVQERDASNPKAKLSPDDSLKQLSEIKAIFADLFKTSYTFDQDGHCSLLGFNIGHSIEDSGTYVWSGDNMINMKTAIDDLQTFVILGLTDTKLILQRLDRQNNKKDFAMTFTRAK